MTEPRTMTAQEAMRIIRDLTAQALAIQRKIDGLSMDRDALNRLADKYRDALVSARIPKEPV